MFFRLRRWYNRNSKMIWRITVIIVFFIIMLQLFNYFEGRNNNIKDYIIDDNLTKEKYSDLYISDNKSVLSNDKISSSKYNSIEVINTFFDYCNDGKIEKAYELLTDECKKQMYPGVKDFKDNYYKIVFNGKKKSISIENWIGDTYKVQIVDNILATGKYDESSIRRDYITIINDDDDNYKLNINQYIDTFEINKSSIFNENLEINVEKRDVYMDYEVYTFKIKNNMDKPIMLDNLKNINSIYLEDKNSLKYYAYTHELSIGELLINQKETRTLKIKFYNKFSSSRKIESIIFSNVILNYSYSLTENKEEINNYSKFKIEI